MSWSQFVTIKVAYVELALTLREGRETTIRRIIIEAIQRTEETS